MGQMLGPVVTRRSSTSHLLSRRATLLGVFAAAALGGPGVAHAEGEDRASDGSVKKSRIVKITPGARGVTIHMELANSPFPAAGSPHRDATVLAFVSHHYRAPEDGTVSVVVHFHGYSSDVEGAVDKH
ncbi:hypothetical protein BH11MYX4_BH11MYX4_13410 [soil metagenome]